VVVSAPPVLNTQTRKDESDLFFLLEPADGKILVGLNDADPAKGFFSHLLGYGG